MNNEKPDAKYSALAKLSPFTPELSVLWKSIKRPADDHEAQETTVDTKPVQKKITEFFPKSN